MSIEELLESERSQIKLELRELRKKRTELGRIQKKLIAKTDRLKRKANRLTKRTVSIGRTTKNG